MNKELLSSINPLHSLALDLSQITDAMSASSKTSQSWNDPAISTSDVPDNGHVVTILPDDRDKVTRELTITWFQA